MTAVRSGALPRGTASRIRIPTASQQGGQNNWPRPGEVVLLDGAASVQFAGDRALRLRVISVCDKPTYHGWCWLTGYALDKNGAATERREVYVRVAGLRPLSGC